MGERHTFPPVLIIDYRSHPWWISDLPSPLSTFLIIGPGVIAQWVKAKFGYDPNGVCQWVVGVLI